MAFVLAHISDVHLGPLPPVSVRDLLSKRLTGYLNWQGNRAGALSETTVLRLTGAIADHRPDHIAVTGDLTNLALDAELQNAAAWLKTLGDPADVSVVPGNHDAYVRGAIDRALTAWAAWLTGDDGVAPATNAGFPYLRVRGPVAVIGLSSAVATPPFIAAGRFDPAQAERLARVLRQAGEAGLFRIVLIHHPPVRNAAVPSKRLYGIGRFHKVVADHGAELVLHGHTHRDQRHAIHGPGGARVPVIGVPAAGQSPGGHWPPAAFNRFRIDQVAGQWRCAMQTWSVTGDSGPLALTDEHDLWPQPTDDQSS